MPRSGVAAVEERGEQELFVLFLSGHDLSCEAFGPAILLIALLFEPRSVGLLRGRKMPAYGLFDVKARGEPAPDITRYGAASAF